MLLLIGALLSARQNYSRAVWWTLLTASLKAHSHQAKAKMLYDVSQIFLWSFLLFFRFKFCFFFKKKMAMRYSFAIVCARKLWIYAFNRKTMQVVWGPIHTNQTGQWKREISKYNKKKSKNKRETSKKIFLFSSAFAWCERALGIHSYWAKANINIKLEATSL